MRNNGIHIRIGDLIYGMIKHRALIIALTCAGLLVGIVISGISFLRGEMSKEYIVTSSFSVNTQTRTGLFTSGYDFPSYNDINMATRLVDAVSYVIKSDKMMNEIIESLGLLGITNKDITENLRLTQYADTQIIEMTLYWRSSQEGISILNAINSKSPKVLMDSLKIGSISVLNAPSSKYLIGGKINILLWGYMALLGLIIGLAIVLLELIMHPTLLNTQDIEQAYGVEILCEIAEDKAYFSSQHAILIDDDSNSSVRDGFSSASHIIASRLRKKPGPHIMYITSALRGEGKTNMLANLAITLSDLEKRVLLVDFDMRNPTLATVFMKNIAYEHSLNALYAGDITEREAVVSLTGYLDIMPTILERSAIPLDSNLFSIIEKLAVHYDYVLIDTAPVGMTADPMSLNQIATSALFVVRYDTASLQEIKDALERVHKSGVSILGCIINGIQVSSRVIKTPAKERAEIQAAQHRAQNRYSPLTSLNRDDDDEEEEALAAPAERASQEARPLVAGFASEKGDDDDDIRTDSTDFDAAMLRYNQFTPSLRRDSDQAAKGNGLNMEGDDDDDDDDFDD